MYCVYKHTTPNGKVYIGITCQKPSKRWGYGNNYLKQKYFGSAIRKYGWNNIKHEIIATGLTKEEACQKERDLIAQYKSHDRKYGYNLSIGGESGAAGVIVSAETRKKLSESRKGAKNHMYGKHLSEERKRQIGEWTRLHKSGKNHWNYGNHYSEEFRKKLSEAHKGKQAGANHPNAKKVINLDTGKIYDTLTMAAQSINRAPSSIVLSAKTGIKGGGYYWAYYNEMK